jgi:glycosyltransferase involved in cell wall biosynthesis
MKLVEGELHQNTFTLPNKPFLLHVGSNLPRKNRAILPQILNGLQANFDGYLCFAGKRPDRALECEIARLNLSQRVMIFENVSHQELNLLYNTCFAFVFPSFSEGFGWPVIEAQICGAPVICSDMEPFREITNDSALLANPNNPMEFVNQIQKLKDPNFRNSLIEKGKENAKIYSKERMISAYVNLYKKIIQ